MSLYPTDQLLNIADEEARKQGVDPATARAILLSENGGKKQIDTETVSPKGAYGIMQVMPTTAANLQRMGYFSGDPTTPEGQIRLGVAALKELKDRGISKPAEMAVAYNGGNAALDAFRSGKTMNGETTFYLQNFAKHLGGDPMADTSTSTPGGTTVTNVRESYSTSEKQMDPATRAAINTRVANANALHDDTRTQLQELTRGILGNTEDQIAAGDKAAQAEAQGIQAQTTQKTATLDNTQSILNSFGINLNNPDNDIAKRVALIRSNANEKDSLMNQIGALDNESPLTNPVGWLVNQVKQYPLIQRHNALVNQSTGAAKEIELLQGMASNQERLQPAMIQDAINAEGLARVNQVLANAGVKKAELVGAARSKVAQMLLHIDETEQTNLRSNIVWADTNSVTVHEGGSTSDKNKPEDESLKSINTLAAAWGFEPTWNKVTFGALDKETKEKWVKAAQLGREGVSPGDAVSMLYNTYGGAGLAKMNKDAPVAGKMMQDIVKAGQTTFEGLQARAVSDLKLQSQLKKLKTPMDELAFGIDTWAKSKEEELKSNNMSKVSADSPYKLQPAYVANTTELKDNPLSQFINQKKVTGIQVDDTLLLSSALADVTTGKRKVGDVADYVHEFYTKGMDVQRRDTTAGRVGFKAQDKYPVVQALTTLRGYPVDLFNKQSIENFLIQQAASQLTDSSGGFTPMGDFGGIAQ